MKCGNGLYHTTILKIGQYLKIKGQGKYYLAGACELYLSCVTLLKHLSSRIRLKL